VIPIYSALNNSITSISHQTPWTHEAGPNASGYLWYADNIGVTNSNQQRGELISTIADT
jgi:hypothetical protein